MAVDDDLIALLDGLAGPKQVELRTGVVLQVFNIAWGYDDGDGCAHVTSNVSPSPPESHTVDVFSTRDIEVVRDEEGVEVYRRA